MLAAEKIELLRVAAFDLLGGVCAACGDYDRTSLHIHHIEPIKTPSGRGQDRRAWEGLKIAVCKKALLLCPYCHGMIHSNDTMIWMQSDKSQDFREAMRRDFIDSMDSLYVEDVQIYKCGQG